MRWWWLGAAVLAWHSCTATISAGNVLDPNFEESVVVAERNALASITGIDWAPDASSRLFVIRKTGEVHIIKNGALLPAPFATITPIFLNSECGLIGFCFDPNFATNRFVYFFVTVSATEQQIIRYTDANDVGTNKTVLLGGLPTAGQNHDGGAIGIGPDGKLYFGIGDLGNGTGVDGDLTSLAAKIGRANLDGTIPADNPFNDGTGPNNDYIWARGFRNPFTLTFQPGTGKLWVNDVGTNYEQVFIVNAGEHAGWNDYENNQPAGFIRPVIKYRTNGVDTRTIASAARQGNVVTFTTTAAHGFRPSEKIDVSGVAAASFNAEYFVASVPAETTFTAAQTGPDEAVATSGGTATTQNIGGAVTGGTFYTGTAFAAAYRGNYFFGDFNTGRILRATLDANNNVSSVDFFVTGIVNYIDIVTGPDGALYYASFSDGTIYKLAAKMPAPADPSPGSGSDNPADHDGDGVANDADTDDDNDGVSDANELADGTNPLDANSLSVTPLTVRRLAGVVNFRSSNRDSVQLQGTLPGVAAISDVDDLPFVVNIGGVSATFDLNERAQDRDSNGTLALRMKLRRERGEDRASFAGGDVPFTVKLTRGTFADDWADEGIDPMSDARNQAVSLAVEIRFNDRVYRATVETLFTGKAGRGGRFKN